ncbi:MAG: hypothetical protein EPN92_11120 [Chitinophagaceae bacterium]|nr:MAG: hypothetical protein EPN92_11120 [Chitinophagaceae bacterium]
MYLALFITILSAMIGLGLFQYLEQKRKNRVMEQHERKREQFEALLKLISDKNAEECDATGDDKRTEP